MCVFSVYGILISVFTSLAFLWLCMCLYVYQCCRCQLNVCVSLCVSLVSVVYWYRYVLDLRTICALNKLLLSVQVWRQQGWNHEKYLKCRHFLVFFRLTGCKFTGDLYGRHSEIHSRSKSYPENKAFPKFLEPYSILQRCSANNDLPWLREVYNLNLLLVTYLYQELSNHVRIIKGSSISS